MSKTTHAESLFARLKGPDRLHLRRFYRKPLGPPVLMLHGSIENGKIYYSKSGKGLAPYLAKNGFDVYVGDLRGRGGSTPPIGRGSAYGQTEAIVEDIPAMMELLLEMRGDTPVHWVAHSWGGVLMASCLARFPELAHRVESLICFAAKRTIRVFNWEKFLIVDLLWNRIAPAVVALCGYVPAREIRFGSDNETKKSYEQNRAWIARESRWIDCDDDFNYEREVKKVKWPPTLHLAGSADRFLGNPRDVYDFVKETSRQGSHFRILSRKTGHLHDYDHMSLLTHPDAERDHFPMVLRWLKEKTYRKELLKTPAVFSSI